MVLSHLQEIGGFGSLRSQRCHSQVILSDLFLTTSLSGVAVGQKCLPVVAPGTHRDLGLHLSWGVPFCYLA